MLAEDMIRYKKQQHKIRKIKFQVVQQESEESRGIQTPDLVIWHKKSFSFFACTITRHLLASVVHCVPTLYSRLFNYIWLGIKSLPFLQVLDVNRQSFHPFLPWNWRLSQKLEPCLCDIKGRKDPVKLQVFLSKESLWTVSFVI